MALRFGLFAQCSIGMRAAPRAPALFHLDVGGDGVGRLEKFSDRQAVEVK
jgi:hypothetical protein